MDETLDPSRRCARCGKAFITYGAIRSYERSGRPVPTTHQAGPGGTYPAGCVPVATPDPAVDDVGAGCFVATSIYGSYDCPEVRVLRRWRDTSLVPTRRGRALVRLYYDLSPQLVELVGHKGWFTRPARRVLDRRVEALMRSGISDGPYRDPDQRRYPSTTSHHPNGAN
jgi:hypothetical protein